MSEHATPVDSYLEGGELTATAWANALRDHVILGQECGACGHKTAAPKAACARCGSRELAVIRLPETGRVYSETTISVPPAGYEGPYKVAIIALDEETRILAQVDEGAEIGDEAAFTGVIEEDPSGIPSPIFE